LCTIVSLAVLCVHLWVILKYTHPAHEAYVLNIRSASSQSQRRAGFARPDGASLAMTLNVLEMAFGKK
jgi:hypothetical protein